MIEALKVIGTLSTFFLTGPSRELIETSESTTIVNDPAHQTNVQLKNILKNQHRKEIDLYESMLSESACQSLVEILRTTNPDFVIVQSTQMAPYLRVIQENTDAVIIVDLDESQFNIINRLIDLRADRVGRMMLAQWRDLVTEYQNSVVDSADAIWLASGQELENFRSAHLIEASVLKSKFAIVPNCVQWRNYFGGRFRKVKPKSLIFTAQFQYEPNLDALVFLTNELLPLLPGYTLDLVGGGLPDWVNQSSNPQIHPVGRVESVVPLLAQSEMALIPLRAGGGTRLKALEAMATGTPIISTRLGVEGLEIEDRVNVLLAENPHEFQQAVYELEQNKTLRFEITKNALELVKSKYSVEALTQVLRHSLVKL
jgi:glycosyltransferase involved in cell wall biosynthesis